MKTNKSYQNAIREKYLSDKASSKLRDNLYKLTPSNIRNVCLSLINEDLSKIDQDVMRNFFNPKERVDLRKSVLNCNIDGFRPICKFLKGDTDSLTAHDTLELTALIVNFKRRPYSKYRSTDHDTWLKDLEVVTPSVVEGGAIKSDADHAKAEGDTGGLPPLYLRIIGVLFVAVTGFMLCNPEAVGRNFGDCMVWNVDHYERGYCSGGDLEVTLDKTLLKAFKKIEVCEDSVFFEYGKPVVHYLKFNNKIEFFTHSGEHPVYLGKYLKPITRTIINAHVRPCDLVVE